MDKINFQDLPNTTTPVSATNLNQLQTNVENVFNGNEPVSKIVIPKDSTKGIYSTDNKKILSNHANNNVVLNATGGTLYLGNSETTAISFFENNQIKFEKNGSIGEILLNGSKIFESGSNSNGHYIKYADGTMIQWNKVQVSDQAISNAYGSLFQGTRNITFPIAFVGNLPTVQCSEFQWGSGASWGCCVGSATTLTSSQLRGFDITSRTEGTLCNISWLAIGRWK